MEERLSFDQWMDLNSGKYYNVEVSNYQCIKQNVGQKCTDAAGGEGTCVML